MDSLAGTPPPGRRSSATTPRCATCTSATSSPPIPNGASGSPPGRRPLPRLLEEPRHRRDARACSSRSPRSRAARADATRCSAASASTSPRTAPCSTSRCGCRASARSSSTARTSSPTSTSCSTGWRAFSDRIRSGRVEGPHRQADPQRRQHRHRRLRPRARDGLRGAPRLQAPRPRRSASSRTSTATDFAEATRDLDPAETLFIVSSKTFTTLETMTNARTARALAARRARRRGGGREALRRRLDERRRRWRAFGIDTGEHVRLLGLGRRALLDGLGDRALDDDRDRAGAVRASCSPASTRWTSTSARRRSSANLPALMGLLGVWYADFFGAQTIAVHALRPVPAALPRLPPAADDGVERQARHARRPRASTTTRAPSSGASRARTASTRSTS